MEDPCIKVEFIQILRLINVFNKKNSLFTLEIFARSRNFNIWHLVWLLHTKTAIFLWTPKI